MLAVLLGIYALLWCDQRENVSSLDWTRYAWATAMIASVFFSMRSTLHLERTEREEYTYRVPLQTQGFLNAEPQSTATGIRYAAFTMTGYRLIAQNQDGVQESPPPILQMTNFRLPAEADTFG